MRLNNWQIECSMFVLISQNKLVNEKEQKEIKIHFIGRNLHCRRRFVPTVNETLTISPHDITSGGSGSLPHVLYQSSK